MARQVFNTIASLLPAGLTDAVSSAATSAASYMRGSYVDSTYDVCARIEPSQNLGKLYKDRRPDRKTVALKGVPDKHLSLAGAFFDEPFNIGETFSFRSVNFAGSILMLSYITGEQGKRVFEDEPRLLDKSKREYFYTKEYKLTHHDKEFAVSGRKDAVFTLADAGEMITKFNTNTLSEELTQALQAKGIDSAAWILKVIVSGERLLQEVDYKKVAPFETVDSFRRASALALTTISKKQSKLFAEQMEDLAKTFGISIKPDPRGGYQTQKIGVSEEEKETVIPSAERRSSRSSSHRSRSPSPSRRDDDFGADKKSAVAPQQKDDPHSVEQERSLSPSRRQPTSLSATSRTVHIQAAPPSPPPVEQQRRSPSPSRQLVATVVSASASGAVHTETAPPSPPPASRDRSKSPHHQPMTAVGSANAAAADDDPQLGKHSAQHNPASKKSSQQQKKGRK